MQTARRTVIVSSVAIVCLGCASAVCADGDADPAATAALDGALQALQKNREAMPNFRAHVKITVFDKSVDRTQRRIVETDRPGIVAVEVRAPKTQSEYEVFCAGSQIRAKRPPSESDGRLDMLFDGQKWYTRDSKWISLRDPGQMSGNFHLDPREFPCPTTTMTFEQFLSNLKEESTEASITNSSTGLRLTFGKVVDGHALRRTIELSGSQMAIRGWHGVDGRVSAFESYEYAPLLATKSVLMSRMEVRYLPEPVQEFAAFDPGSADVTWRQSVVTEVLGVVPLTEAELATAFRFENPADLPIVDMRGLTPRPDEPLPRKGDGAKLQGPTEIEKPISGSGMPRWLLGANSLFLACAAACGAIWVYRGYRRKGS